SIFPTDEALLKMLYLATMDVTRKWTGRVQNWGQILLQLSVFFPDRIGHHSRFTQNSGQTLKTLDLQGF
ncbi:hypothetical protein CBW46_014395, partial [Paenibacillus xerothermodurans]